MITKKDRQLLIQDMKEVFATKDDLKAMEKRFDGKFATKDDLKTGLRTVKTELLVELSKTRDEIVRQIIDVIDEKLLPLLEAHNRRISRVEKYLKLSPFID